MVVTATNGGGSTAASSQQTGPVVGLPPSSTGLPSISGTAQEGQTLTASNGSWTGSPASFAYRWRDCDVSGAGCVDIADATAATYVLRASDVGSTVRVVVIATNGGGSTAETSAQTLAVLEAPLSNSVLPSIAGTARQGGTLTASTGTWFGHPGSFAYQWRDCDASGATCADIAGAVGPTYLVQVGDVGQTLRVVVTATNTGASSAATSQQTAVVTAAVAAPANTAPPSIAGTAQEGETLTASVGSWTDDPTSFAYRWRACDASGNNCVDIAGATGSTYLLKASDVASTLRMVVTATNAGGSTSATSASSGQVLMAAPANTGSPSLSGTAQVAQTLTASVGTWSGSPTSFTYRWRACDVSGSNCVDIAGATDPTYAPQASDIGFTLRVVVTATNAGGSTAATSQQTVVVIAAVAAPANTVPPTVSGTAQAGQTLTASTGTWTGSPTSFAYQLARLR